MANYTSRSSFINRLTNLKGEEVFGSSKRLANSVQNIELHNKVGNIQYATGCQHKYFFSIPGHLEIPKGNNLLELEGGCCMSTSFVILGSIILKCKARINL